MTERLLPSQEITNSKSTNWERAKRVLRSREFKGLVSIALIAAAINLPAHPLLRAAFAGFGLAFGYSAIKSQDKQQIQKQK